MRHKPKHSRASMQGAGFEGLRRPAHAVTADPAAQAPNNSYEPPLWYATKKYTCRDCGISCTWTAEEQKRDFEVKKMSIYKIRVRCGPCEMGRRRLKMEQKRHMAEMAERKAERRSS